MTEKPKFPHTYTSGSGSGEGYFVEARYTYVEPKEICGQLFDQRWKQVIFQPASGGVPNHKPHDAAKHLTGLLDYAAANALRWWFVANASLSHDDICLETRIVCCSIKYSYEAVADMAMETIGFRGRPLDDESSDAEATP